MPRASKGARLYKRKARYRNGKLVAQSLWIIRDGSEDFATGCVASASETKPPREAEQALADYIARKYQPERRRRDIEDIDCADVLSIYLVDIGEPGNQFEIEARIDRLNNFWGGKMTNPAVVSTRNTVGHIICMIHLPLSMLDPGDRQLVTEMANLHDRRTSLRRAASINGYHRAAPDAIAHRYGAAVPRLGLHTPLG